MAKANLTSEQRAQQIRDLAANYAKAEPSDPFLAARIATHMRNGIAGEFFDERNRRIDANYIAHETAETRAYEGADGKTVEYTVPAYRNRSRP